MLIPAPEVLLKLDPITILRHSIATVEVALDDLADCLLAGPVPEQEGDLLLAATQVEEQMANSLTDLLIVWRVLTRHC